jgi:PIN domain nuclease of toxin-antitoxin system
LLPRFLLDTHILIRWIEEPGKLSREQFRVIRSAEQRGEQVLFSAMTLLEIASLTGLRKLKLRSSLDEFLASLKTNPFFEVLPLTYEIALELASLGRVLPDPADRTIVATARVHRLRLITSDERIAASGLVKVIE